MIDPDSNYVTEREIMDIMSFEISKLDQEIWPRDNAGASRHDVMAHFERIRQELLKKARSPRRVHLSNGNRESGKGADAPEPSDWASVPDAEFERNRERYREKTTSHRSAVLRLGGGKVE